VVSVFNGIERDEETLIDGLDLVVRKWVIVVIFMFAYVLIVLDVSIFSLFK
jgi:hypothetical protein